MRFSMSWRLRQVGVVFSVGIALVLWWAAASEQAGRTLFAMGDEPSTLHVLSQPQAATERSDEPAASAEPAAGSTTSADPLAGEASSSDQRASDEGDEAPNGPLKPIPDPRHSAPVPVETAGFKGVTPGVTTLGEVERLWGPPKQVGNRNAQLVHLYSVGPFERVEVSLVRDRVASIVIRLGQSFPAKLVAEQLEMTNIQPVLVSNELGEILGQSFPERGVMFAFEPGDAPGNASMTVAQIILEPISAEPFVLRAETVMDSRPKSSLRDLEQAIRLDPDQARAHWLRSRLLTAAADLQPALEAAGQAVGLEPENPQYRVTRAEILGQLGRVAEAVAAAQKAVLNGAKRPHVKARALCLLGDLVASAAQPDYRQAFDYHVEAIKVADPLAVSRHPAIRLAAKEVLIDAHVGAAHDIAWGPWEQKERAVPRWLDRAAALAKDLAEKEAASVEHEFRVATRALSAYVGLKGQLDATPWTQAALTAGRQLLASTEALAQKQQIMWDLGMALYDVVQICQMRGEHDLALQHGKMAIEYLESGAAARKSSPQDAYLLGRLYFRLGAIYAVGREDHTAAIDWFDKAALVLERSAGGLDQSEWGRLGQTYVSMGVSYWETDRKDRAIELTERGVELVKQAVSLGALKQSALEVPYSNLAAMLRQMGQIEQADQYFEQARRSKGSTTR